MLAARTVPQAPLPEHRGLVLGEQETAATEGAEGGQS